MLRAEILMHAVFLRGTEKPVTVLKPGAENGGPFIPPTLGPDQRLGQIRSLTM